MPTVESMLGKKFNRLTILQEAPSRKGHRYVLCECECGTRKVISFDTVVGLRQISCGCYSKEPKPKRAFRPRGSRLRLSGEVIGRLTVISPAENVGIHTAWFCRCACGVDKIIPLPTLRGKYPSCGCWINEIRAERLRKLAEEQKGKPSHKIKDYTGRRFGRLLVLHMDPVRDTYKNRIRWVVKCDCGTIKSVAREALDTGRVNSCGCLRREDSRQKLASMPIRYGSDNPAWNPNKTQEERELGRKIPGYKEWRTLVYQRDDYTCKCCSKKGMRINAHHLEDYSNNPDLRIEVSNGVTLCVKCHKAFHKAFGNKRNTAEQFYSFLYMKQQEHNNQQSQSEQLQQAA